MVLGVYHKVLHSGEIEHGFTVLGFGDDNGAMRGHIFIDWFDGWWEEIRLIIEAGEILSAGLIREDDPALARAQRTIRATEADGFRRPTENDVTIGVAGLDIRVLRPGAAFYSLNPHDGTMTAREIFIEDGRSTYAFCLFHLTSRRVTVFGDVDWFIENRFVRR